MHDPVPQSVVHNEDAHRFEITTYGLLAHADYANDGDRLIFNHTFVPHEPRGRNLAAELVKAALADARTRGKLVVPQCSYVARFIERHTEYADLLAG